jgi:hypothetical protein
MRSPSLPFVAPFAVFLALLALHPYLPVSQVVEFVLRFVVVGGFLIVFSRHVIDLRAPHWLGSISLGVAVCAVWIGPDLLWPHYREHWLFQNAVTGNLRSSLKPGTEENAVALAVRFLRAAVLVPIVEELFWRAWLMRWLVKPEFQKLPMGTCTTQSFWIVAAMFASEHGPFWDVGLLAGIAYNWWMVRTKSLGDCILAHAVTNGCLSAYVLLTKNWQYWM